jgi:hypothetical protein
MSNDDQTDQRSEHERRTQRRAKFGKEWTRKLEDNKKPAEGRRVDQLPAWK